MDEGIMTVDIGTSSIRVSLFDLQGNVIGRKSAEAFAPAQFDAEEQLEKMLSLMRQVRETYSSIEVVRICTSTLVSWTFTGKDGMAITPVYTFSDYHEEEMQKFLGVFDERDFYERTGRSVSAEHPIFKFMWLREVYPEKYENADKLLSYQGYINLRFTGNAFMDRTFAAFTGLYNLKEENWDQKILQAANVDGEKLPRLCECSHIVGTLTKEMQKILGMGAVQVVNGTIDGTSGVLGSGVIAPYAGVDVMGTTDVFYVISDKPVFEKQARLSVHPHPVKGLWLIGGATGLTGGAFDWAVKVLGQGNLSYDDVNRKMEQIPPGSEGLKAVCAFAGERAPRWLPKIRGGFANLTLEHTLAHCCKALSEASAYVTKEICRLLEQEGLQVGEITAIGGGAKAHTILQIRSDVLNCTVNVPEYPDATSRGCYTLAMMSLGKDINEIDINRKVEKICPDSDRAFSYEGLYKDYIAFYEHYKKIYE